MLKWREREHELEDKISSNDLDSMLVLRSYVLAKVFKIHGMRSRVRLLEFLVKMWELDEQVLKVGFHDLDLEIEDIYFLTRLSR
jgi:hypothetical protein